MPTILLGNESVLEPVPSAGATATVNGDTEAPQAAPVPRPDLGAQITSITLPDTYRVEHGVQEGEKWVPVLVDGKPVETTMWGLDEQIKTVRDFVAQMFADKPSWVESDDSLIATVVAQEYGCPVGRPKGWETGKGLSGVKAAPQEQTNA